MTKSDLPIDSWREIPAMPQNGYPGMTELRLDGRTWQVAGVGAAVRKALKKHVASARYRSPARAVLDEIGRTPE